MREFFFLRKSRKRRVRSVQALRKAVKRNNVRTTATEFRSSAIDLSMKSQVPLNDMKIKKEVEKTEIRLRIACDKKQKQCLLHKLLNLSEYAYDAARSGSPEQLEAIVKVTQTLLNDCSATPSSFVTSEDALQSVSKSIFLLALAGIQDWSLFDCIMKHATRSLITWSKTNRVLATNLACSVMDKIAAAGFDSERHSSFAELIDSIVSITNLKGAHIERKKPISLFSSCGYPLHALWLHSTKQVRTLVIHHN